MRDDPRLSEEELALLRTWVDEGAVQGEGDPAPGTPATSFPFEDIPPDLVFDIGADYTADPTLTDDYRCFLAEVDIPQAQMVVASRVSPTNLASAHHTIVAMYEGAALEELQALDAASERPGWECFSDFAPGTELVGTGALSFWVPGLEGREAFPGAGTQLASDGVAVIQMHYNTRNGVAPDRTRVEAWYAPDPRALQRQFGLSIGTQDIVIPAGASETMVSETYPIQTLARGSFFPDGDAVIVGVRAHGHLLMTRHRLILNQGRAGEKVLLDIPAWDFHWQGEWLYQETLPLAADDALTIECFYNNSAEYREKVGLDPDPIEVGWGEGTTDEMCGGGIYVLDDAP
jgi:hypothetical protein